MQLAATLFTMVIVQIKPQMEKVLGLPPHSLAKEIALTQTLMQLFIKVRRGLVGTWVGAVILAVDGCKHHLEC